MSGRVFVIGDIHGCVEELDRLLGALSPERDDTLCFLGDYIDRGPRPRAVIDRLLRLRTECPRCVFLKGNHEDMFLSYLELPGRYGDSFLENGGEPTLSNYDLLRQSGSEAAKRMPPDHLEFLTKLRMRFAYESFLCVHAGVRPTRPLAAQRDEDLLWIREDFTEAKHSFPVTVLHGHTPRKEVVIDLPYRIGLDTGVVYGHWLSCFEIRGKRLTQIQRKTYEVREYDLAAQFDRARPRVA